MLLHGELGLRSAPLRGGCPLTESRMDPYTAPPVSRIQIISGFPAQGWLCSLHGDSVDAYLLQTGQPSYA